MMAILSLPGVHQSSRVVMVCGCRIITSKTSNKATTKGNAPRNTSSTGTLLIALITNRLSPMGGGDYRQFHVQNQDDGEINQIDIERFQNRHQDRHGDQNDGNDLQKHAGNQVKHH